MSIYQFTNAETRTIVQYRTIIVVSYSSDNRSDELCAVTAHYTWMLSAELSTASTPDSAASSAT
jgi:hypothetical protein